MRKGVEVSNWIVGGNQGGIDPARSGVLFSNVTARWCEAIENKKSKFVKDFCSHASGANCPRLFPGQVRYSTLASLATEATYSYLGYLLRTVANYL